MKAWSGEAGQIAQAVVEDTTGRVTEAWTGPQVAWKMARGRDGAFGGKTLLKPYVWLAFCLVFLVGLADLRRPLSDAEPRPARAPRLLGLARVLRPRRDLPQRPARLPGARVSARPRALGRVRQAPGALSSVWPTWALAAAAVFLLGFRVGLNLEAPRGVIDVGLAGVVGANRILDGEAPYGNMPQRGDPRAVRPEGRRGQRARAHPDERALRGGDRARRHVRPGLLPGLRAGDRGLRLEREVGLACPPRTRPRSRSTCSPSSRSC